MGYIYMSFKPVFFIYKCGKMQGKPLGTTTPHLWSRAGLRLIGAL